MYCSCRNSHVSNAACVSCAFVCCTAHRAVKREDKDLIVITIVVACAALRCVKLETNKLIQERWGTANHVTYCAQQAEQHPTTNNQIQEDKLTTSNNQFDIQY